eukprot:1034687-Prymnesium_polylepis.1
MDRAIICHSPLRLRQNEILSTFKWRRPFFLVHEADPKHGGKPWAQLVADCPVELTAAGRFGSLPHEYRGPDGRGDFAKWARHGWFAKAAEAPTTTQQIQLADLIFGPHRTSFGPRRTASDLFEGQAPIMWHRLPDL